MKIDVNDMERIKNDLRNVSDAPWIRVAAQVMDFGDEAHFWLMIASEAALADCVSRFAETLEPFLHAFEETEFNFAVSTRNDADEFVLAYIVDDELRNRRLALELEDQGTFKRLFNEAFWRENG